MTLGNGHALLRYGFRADLPGTIVRLEQSTTLADGSWTPVDSMPLSLADGVQEREAEVSSIGKNQTFFRMVVLDAEQ